MRENKARSLTVAGHLIWRHRNKENGYLLSDNGGTDAK